MAYDDAFFEKYLRYLNEPTVRESHDFIFKLWQFSVYPSYMRVLDLGCGTGEYYKHGVRDHYVGVDLEPRIDVAGAHTITGSYILAADRKKWIKDLPFEPNAFISLFSIEPVLPIVDRHYIYQKLFAEIPTLKYGLSSGFYYTDKMDRESVAEAGGIVSWQTLDPVGFFPSQVFAEKRVVLPVPSELFGLNVVEVWKILTRR